MKDTQADEPPLPLLLLANDLCNRLEAGWRAGDPPALEALLAGVPAADRAAVLHRLIPLDLDYRRLAGEDPSLDEYRARFPGFAGDDDPSEVTQPWLVTLDTLFERLELWQLLKPEALAEERARAGTVPARAMRLVAAGALTRFQANQLIRTTGVPLVLDDHVLLDLVGSGGMGHVYRVWHRRLGKVLALKLLRGAASPSRFEREARAAAQLQHPNVVPIYHAGEANGTLYLVMPLIAGRDLARVVREDGPLPLPRALDFVRQAARGLQHAHECGIVHRDVKPGNLMLDATGVVYVLDLGLAKNLTSDGESATTSGTVLGTRNYLAPEQYLAPAQVDGRADVYGLGCTLHYLLTGQPPGPTPARLPRAVGELVRRMTAPSPRARPRSMAAVLAELDALERPPRRWPWVAAALLASLLAWFLWPWARTTEPAIEAYPLADAGAYQQRWAAHLGLPVRYRDAHGIDFVLVPPARLGETTLSRAYYLATTETTTAQFRRFVAAQPAGFTTRGERDGGWGLVAGEWLLRHGFSWRDLGEMALRDDHPVGNVTGDEAELYCRWLTNPERLYRLPSEAEWEHACRAGNLGRWCFGDDEPRLAQYAWTADKASTLQPVAQLRANAFGLYDVHGNHAEWCRPDEPTALTWPVRGGRFRDGPAGVTSAARRLTEPGQLEAGFRVVLEIPER